ncbi:ferritin-like domain-containing protein [Peribacillus sp. B-H-3]|uniref:ferritin-like domain-containing protein n=1 Tax=Peribacillus sp. B-H-3 TaxID=3400420 RepID=UPI003B0186DA
MVYYESDMFDRATQDAQLINDLMQAINGEYSAIACYRQIAKNASSEKQRNRILEIRKDEKRHLNIFSSIYTQLTGKRPEPKILEACPVSYKKGLEFAIEDEQNTVDFYNEIAEKAQTPYIREQFLRAARDEQNHAVWFLYFLTKRL